MLHDWWTAFVQGFTHTAPLSVPVSELAWLVAGAAALCVIPVLWRFFGRFVTIVHELGHAFAGLATGMRVTGIMLRMDQGGTTQGMGRGRAVWFGFWGYPAPAVVGAALVWASAAGWGRAALSAAVVVLVAVFLFIRNLQGVLILSGAILVVALLVVAVPPELQGHLTLGVGVALVFGAARDWWNLVSVHTARRRELASSDAFILARKTRVPAALWLLSFAIVIGACGAAAWLVLRVVA
ncbi:M50 family metallopeptidase [Sinomonas sp. ASV322]|uniref:M50 family metallopeptidase n=1 Tax=Sinomonas sp. ASV322 TaxID=3041920 RepID=UPI0027DD4DA8|nr:M50 family metallopeptidase [Sinomonas sp. ASV322]MDQ4501668.1 M50 family metallopeptidase [Sinomonas sp. ASV322]